MTSLLPRPGPTRPAHRRAVTVIAMVALSSACGSPPPDRRPVAAGAPPEAPEHHAPLREQAPLVPPPGPVKSPAEAVESASEGPVLTGFDCTSSMEEKRGLRLREENAGPLGATWNWHAGSLRCHATVVSACQGEVSVRLHVGDRHIVEQRSPTAPPSVELAFEIPAKTWTAALRESPPLPYETLTLMMEVVVLCADRPVHRTDAFVGRFGSGE